MNTRNQIITSYIIKILIVVLVVIISSFLYFRIDLSKSKSYTLGKATKETLHSLKDKVIVKVFASQDLPQELSTINRNLKDMLEEFARNSHNKFSFEYVRASNNKELIEQARDYDIPAYSFTAYEDEKLVTKQVVFGLYLESAGKSSSMYLRPGMEQMMEYQLLKQINKLHPDNLPELTVFMDSLSMVHQYTNYSDALATFFLELMDNYRITYTDLNTRPKQTPVMLCLGTIDTLSTKQLYYLDQYLMQNGNIVMTQDRALMFLSERGSALALLDGPIFRLLEHYGIRIEPNIVLDMECEYGRGSGLGTIVPYPFIPRLRPNPKFPYTAGFPVITMNIASEINPVPDAKIKFEKVLQTSNHSNVLIGPDFRVDIAVQKGLDPGYLSQPPKTVAAEVSGTFHSFFHAALDDSTFYNSTDKSKIILFADSEFSLEFSAGAFIVLNAVDYLLGRNDMIKIRSPRDVYNELSAEVYMQKHQMQPAEQEKTISILNRYFRLTAIFLPVLLLALFGIIQASRHAAKIKYEEK